MRTSTKAKQIAKGRYEKDVITAITVANSQVQAVMTQYANKCFTLAVKHAKTIKDIEKEIIEKNTKNEKKGSHNTDCKNYFRGAEE